MSAYDDLNYITRVSLDRILMEWPPGQTFVLRGMINFMRQRPTNQLHPTFLDRLRAEMNRFPLQDETRPKSTRGAGVNRRGRGKFIQR